MSSEGAPVVLYDIERSADTSPPDIPRILHAKRRGTRRLPGPAPRAPLPRDRAGILGAQPGAHSPELQGHPAEA